MRFIEETHTFMTKKQRGDEEYMMFDEKKE